MAKLPKNISPHPSFPKLKNGNHKVKSPCDPQYNCIAFAAGITDKSFWPNNYPVQVWLPNIPNAQRVESFVKFYETFGYSVITDGGGEKYEKEWEKIAIYARLGREPTHAARQVGPNKWISKLGEQHDIQHYHDAVSGGDYGEPCVYMRRKRPT